MKVCTTTENLSILGSISRIDHRLFKSDMVIDYHAVFETRYVWTVISVELFT